MKKNILISIILCAATAGIIYFFATKNKAPILETDRYQIPDPSASSSATQESLAATSTPSAPLLQTSKNFMHMITIETNYGKIVFETYDADAPKTVQNFIDLSSKGFYENVIFHRVIPGFMIQGGDPTGTGSGGPGYQFADELNPATVSYKTGYKKGVVAMANAGPNTNGSQFFIMLADNPLPNNYTIFGKVIDGQSVVDAIGKVATDPSDRPLSNVVIKKVTVENKK